MGVIEAIGTDGAATGVQATRLVSTDVFDTLFYRTTRSERERTSWIEKSFSKFLAGKGLVVCPHDLWRFRMQAQEIAFRAQSVGENAGEVRLLDILDQQFKAFSIPAEYLPDRLALEIEIETRSLIPNHELIAELRAHKQEGHFIVATSDTILPLSVLTSLIAHFGLSDLFDRIYSSAEEGASKRQGALFGRIMDDFGVWGPEILHIGDDLTADVKVPSRFGMKTRHQPRPTFLGKIRRARGLVQTVGHRLAGKPACADIARDHRDAVSFSCNTLGPIAVEFSARIWLYAQQASQKDMPVLLFCARGGLGIREIFERTLDRFGLALDVRRENFLVSRLIAARAALLKRDQSVFDELQREFRGCTNGEVANSLAASKHALADPRWDEPFDAERFAGLVFGPAGTKVQEDIRQQHGLFLEHLDHVCGDATRIILCDTGLYGSTQRMLQAAIPERKFETVQFARSNYKDLDESHFKQVSGLVVQRNFFSPFEDRSYVLRYWQLIETLFEVGRNSVRVFARDEHGKVTSNLGDIAYPCTASHPLNPWLKGAIQYVEMAGNDLASPLQEARSAWVRLRKSIARPDISDAHLLGQENRSIDFGRTSKISTIKIDFARISLLEKLRWTKRQLWREGALAFVFPHFSGLITLMLDPVLFAYFSARQARRKYRARLLMH